MTDKDPHLLKTLIAKENDQTITDSVTDNTVLANNSSGIGNNITTNYVNNNVPVNPINHADKTPSSNDVETTSVEDATITHKGTETLKSEYGKTEHVKSGDNPARQPDFRDQQGQWFDEGVNENNPEVRAVLDNTPKSEEINEQNRYASIDNAQKRVLPTQDQKPS